MRVSEMLLIMEDILATSGDMQIVVRDEGNYTLSLDDTVEIKLDYGTDRTVAVLRVDS